MAGRKKRENSSRNEEEEPEAVESIDDIVCTE